MDQSQIVELNEVVGGGWRIKRAMFRLASIAVAGGLMYLGAQTFADRAKDFYKLGRNWALSQITRIEVVKEYVEIRPESLPLEALVERAATKHGVPPLLIQALILQESGEKLKPDRMRRESHLAPRFKREGWMNDIEHEILYTSIGLGQIIYGFHREFCGIESVGELFDPARNLDCTASLLRKCLNDKAGIKNKATRFRQCLIWYNGGSDYPAKVERHLVELVLGETL